MSQRNAPIVTYEFCTLYIEGQAHKEGETALSKETFNNLWDFILSSRATDDSDVVMSLHTRGGRKYIKTGRYVGTIQTKNGQTIEILPKIYKVSNEQESDADICRHVFLNMLRHFTDIRARSFQKASLYTKRDFPILEVYISNYLEEVEKLIIGGLKKNYSIVEETLPYLKGRLNLQKQITKNITNQSVFSVRYNKYIENIPQNRVVATTLRKLWKDSHNSTNKAHIRALLNIMSDIPSCYNIENDLKSASSNNRLFSSYDMIIKWSFQFLLNRGFTTFAGEIVNQSLLFKAEKIFEDFIAYLFKKYAPPFYETKCQNAKYFLIDKHEGRKMFNLRPDIVVEKDKYSINYDCVIIDTKWKALDSTRPDKNYLIDIKDMYQLYAYGHKYRNGHINEVGIDVVPNLVLIYPYSNRFTSNLPEFVYDEIKEQLGIRLMVVPFNLSEPKTYEKQVQDIIQSVSVESTKQPIYRNDWETDTLIMFAADQSLPNKQTTLVGCYKNEKHLEWILCNNLYNIRLGNRKGAIKNIGMVIPASRLVLYNFNKPEEYQVFELNKSQYTIADYNLMLDKKYPEPKPTNKYVLYSIKEESIVKPYYNIEDLKRRFAPKDAEEGAPFYFTI